MRFPNGGRPPPARNAGDGPRIEQPARTLTGKFNVSGALSQDAPTALPRERITYLAQAIHRLGPRPLVELLLELAAGAPLIPRLEAYARLERYAGFIAANDGDRLPQPRLVPGRRA
jgi:hypothetical protein